MIRLSCLLILSLAASAPTEAATITVTSSADDASNDGVCTLREAIVAANTDQPSGSDSSGDMAPLAGECEAGNGDDAIMFAIPGDGPHTLLPKSALPQITTVIAIDGYSQPGARPNTINTLGGFDADLRIIIDGSQASSGTTSGLRLIGESASGSAIRGIEFANFVQPSCCADFTIGLFNGIDDVSLTGNIVRKAVLRGLYLDPTPNPIERLRVGGPDPGDRNLFVAFTNGRAIALSNCIDCRIENNLFGVAVAGMTVDEAANRIAISTSSATGLVIQDNLISNSTDTGLSLAFATTQTTISNNLIGGAQPNAHGVGVFNNAMLFPQDLLFDGNVIMGNTRSGIRVANNVAGNNLRGVVLRGNRLYANEGLEFDLSSNGGGLAGLGSVTANDAGDGDQGPNALQNFPVLGTPQQVGNVLQVPYALDSAAGTYTIEFSLASQCDPSGHGLHGSMPRDPLAIDTAQLTGTAVLQPVGAPAAGFIVATATGSDGSSEFSACVAYTYSIPIRIFGSGFED